VGVSCWFTPTVSARFAACIANVMRLKFGYRSLGMPGLPFDESTAVIPNEAGRVVNEQGKPVPGEYVAGWAKRGPSGVIGTNKACAREMVAGLLADCQAGTVTAAEWRPSLSAGLRDRRVTATDLAGWLAIDREEIERGAAEGRARSKVADWPTLNELAGAARVSSFDGRE
jgi:ferredoxin--NADP+ reductase